MKNILLLFFLLIVKQNGWVALFWDTWNDPERVPVGVNLLSKIRDAGDSTILFSLLLLPKCLPGICLVQ